MKKIGIDKIIFLAISIFILSLNVIFYETGKYPSYLIVLLLSLALPFLSRKFKFFFISNVNLPLMGVILLGLILRLNFSLFNFLHLNYHGPFYLYAVSKLAGFEAMPYGFTYNVFWFVPNYIFGFISEALFAYNVALNLLTAYLLYLIIQIWFRTKEISLIIVCLFLFSPLQVAISGTESHFILYSLFVCFLLLTTEFIEEKFVFYSLPFTLAFFTFIRPSAFFVIVPYLFYLFVIKHLKIKKIEYSHLFFLVVIYSLLVIVPFYNISEAGLDNHFPSILVTWSYLKNIPHLNIFKTKYYFFLFSLLVALGGGCLIKNAKKHKQIIALIPLMLLALIEGLLKFTGWHISIYYQAHLEIFYFILIACFFSVITDYRISKKLIFFSIFGIIAYQFISKIGTYNKNYDEQIEHNFLTSSRNLFKPFDAFITDSSDPVSRAKMLDTEMFHSYFFFDFMDTKNKGISFYRYSTDQLQADVLDIKPFHRIDRLIYYRSLVTDEDDFIKISNKRGLVLLKDYTFKFEERFKTHIPNGKLIKIGLYQVTK